MPKGHAGRTLETRICPACQKPYQVRVGDGRKTCSRECGKVVQDRVRQATAAARSKQVERQCATCGTLFKTKVSDRGKYCSKACMYARNDTTRDCEVCGKPFRSPPSQAYVRTCSLECGYKVRKSANYKGVTQIEYDADGNAIRRRTKVYKSAHNAGRRAARIQATVSWADKDKIAWFYAQAQELTKFTGMVYHVDHIVPLTSKLVCGLHNEFNLQLLPGPENLRKHNRHWPVMP